MYWRCYLWRSMNTYNNKFNLQSNCNQEPGISFGCINYKIMNIWINRKINKIYNSIAFIPSIVVLCFFGLSVSMIYLDYSDVGKSIKAANNWIRLKDPSTARSVISVIAAGLISITVFSFSMVMVVLNQAASQLSNRVLDKLVGNRFHQFIIGFYIGDIIFALFLLTSVRDIESGVYVPALSTYLLIILTVIAILLFVLFLHFITQSIRYTNIITRIYNQTIAAMKKSCFLHGEAVTRKEAFIYPLITTKAGTFETFDKENIAALLKAHDSLIAFRYPIGHFVLAHTPIADIRCKNETIAVALTSQLLQHISLVFEPDINAHFYGGFKQLSEIALKALSPGINDPGTATVSLQALFALLSYRLQHFPENVVKDAGGVVRIITNELTFDEVFERWVLPIWDYGKDDRTIKSQFTFLLQQLQYLGQNTAAKKLLNEINTYVARSK